MGTKFFRRPSDTMQAGIFGLQIVSMDLIRISTNSTIRIGSDIHSGSMILANGHRVERGFDGRQPRGKMD